MIWIIVAGVLVVAGVWYVRRNPKQVDDFLTEHFY